jgi:hypothetical protein
MKVLFVGGIYPVEFSLFRESQNNPNLTVKFCCDGVSMPDVLPVVNPQIISSKHDIDKIKEQFKPDLTIFRTWCSTEAFASVGDIVWHQEIFPKTDDGIPTGENKVSPWVNAFQSKPRAEKLGGKWLPYCVTNHKVEVEKDIPVMVATSFPGPPVFAMKKKSMDILVKPIIEYDPKLVHFFSGYYGGTLGYLKDVTRPSFSPVDAIKNICRAKIYISPTSIWNDEGCVSYKTVEAMSCGVCTITNDYIGMEDVFGKDGDTIVYANSPQEVLEKTLYYLNHDVEREKLAKRGQDFVCEQYSWEKHLTRLFSKVI